MKFAIDITYLPVEKGPNKFIYLCAIKNIYGGSIPRVPGYRQDVDLVLNALDQLKEKKFVKGAILHSDQGVQFTNFQVPNARKKDGANAIYVTQRKLLG